MSLRSSDGFVGGVAFGPQPVVATGASCAIWDFWVIDEQTFLQRYRRNSDFMYSLSDIRLVPYSLGFSASTELRD